MALEINPVSAEAGAVLTTELTLAEIAAAVVPGLIGMAAVALIAMLMLL